jgi:formate hydrogenlyase subunit 6/NADH:ubiquinone oxidoreductase subunit I
LVIAARCTACLACVEVCPVDAITEGPGPGASPKTKRAA